MDFELEMAFFVGPGNKLGDPISMADAEALLTPTPNPALQHTVNPNPNRTAG